MKRSLLFASILAAFVLPAQAQFGRVTSGAPTGGCGAAILEFDTAGQDVWTCQNGVHKAISTGVLFQSPAANGSVVINAVATLNTGANAATVKGGVMNVAGKTLKVFGYGTYSITTGTPTFALAIKLGATTLATCTSTATTTGATAIPFRFEFVVETIAIGATGNDESHCKLDIVLGAAAGAAGSVFLDNNTAVSSNYDHTIDNVLAIQGTAAGASNAAIIREYTVQLQN